MKLDRVSGASMVADHAFRYLQEWLPKSKNHSSNFFLSGLENRSLQLLCKYPAMGNIYSLMNAVGGGIDRAAKTSAGKTELIREIVRQMEIWQGGERKAAQIIPRLAARAIGSGKTILTLSSSELVKQTFFALKQKKVIAVVLESRPLREGEKAACALARVGIPTTLIIDLAFSSLEKEVDAVLFGTDRIGKTLVNKVGTRALFEWAHLTKKPIFVVCQISKFVPPSWCVLPLPVAPAQEVSKRKHSLLEVRNFYFEESPLDLVDAVITDAGVLNRQTIRRKAAAIETSKWFQLLLKKAESASRPR